MRTIEQITKDYTEAQAEVKTAEQKRDKFKAELQEIYNAAKNALGIQDGQLMFR